MSLSTLARSSLKQFSVIYTEVRAENGDVQGEELETLMWEKIVSGHSSSNKIPSAFLKKLKFDMPFLPDIINYMGCTALKPCGGLYTPCGAKQNDGEPFCASCAKHSAKYGTLAERNTVGNYTDPSDKHEISYGTWLAKNEYNIEDVHADLAENGFTFQIPSSLLTVNSKRVAAPKRRPGRPGAVKKTKVNEDGTESPMGTSLDGHDVKVIIGDEDSDHTISSDEEDEPKKVEKPKKVASPKDAEKKKEEKAAEKERAKAEAAEKKKTEKELAKAVADAKKKSETAETSPKAEKKEKKEKEEKKPKEKKEKKTEKPKTEKPKKTKQEEPEEESEEVVIDGKEYMMVGNKLFDDSGTLVGSIQNGKAEFIHA
jgi:chromatin assembly factor 1 subunit A